MQSTVTIRPANKSDAEAATRLIYPVYQSLIFPDAGPEHEAAIQARLAGFFQDKGSRIGYENTLLAEQDGKVLGLVLSFGGKEEVRLMKHLARNLPDEDIKLYRESNDDEWYVDVLSVSPNAQGKGIGTTLLEAAEDLARRNGYTKISLNVEPENAKALRLYQHLGYEGLEQRTLFGHAHVHMVKHIQEK